MHDQIKSWLAIQNWPFTVDQFKSRSVFKVQVEMQHGSYSTELYAKQRKHFFGVYVYAPVKITQKYQADLMEIIAAANWSYQRARFELRPETGEFRCCSTAYLPNSHLSVEMIEGMTMFALKWLDSCMPMLTAMSEA
jgi:hypothetical protein